MPIFGGVAYRVVSKRKGVNMAKRKRQIINVECARPGCRETFDKPDNHKKKYCSPACAVKANKTTSRVPYVSREQRGERSWFTGGQ
jgi:hypothetical protein